MSLAIAPQRRAFDSAPTPLAEARGVPARFIGVTRRFGQTPVLDGLDLDIPAGQFLAVVGESGCGKSTLLRQLAGLDAPSEGAVAIGGAEPVTRMMFQEPRLLPWRRVLANVEVGLPARVNKAEGRERALSALKAVGLADRAGEWPSVLSGGQKQRVALARALVSRPQLLLLDEPLGALDALTRIDMQRLIERIWLEQGFTAVLVTHDVAEASALADRIVLVDSGKVALDLPAPLPRPRRRGSPESAAIEARILDQLFGA
ncbi:ATP-binding cassette domain-containing protein [Methylocella silvestris]|uniref:Aliphatic sulfonate ABC transporter ATP-binding protein n=1 Tax=Methylocella silvestris TaxID=199596 RepID=A0A2J7TEQ1_METSI|nr:ATP-binding cassette domain-containing protein [Methylocella silvestris]PNG25241.1 aliphatic sulfonate ABC transporter ATP-binding protein [Methylocella silvestris]